MPQVISSESRAWITRMPRPTSRGQLVRLLIAAWWRAWQVVAADLGRAGIR